MPRKPKQEKTTISVVVDGKPIAVTLHPPTGRKKTWYAYWTGLTYSISTGHRELEDAMSAVEAMVRSGGKRPVALPTVVADEDFIAVQRAHYAKPQGDRKKKSAAKSLEVFMEAFSAFREITGLSPVTMATEADCENFQREALKKSRNWRTQLRRQGQTQSGHRRKRTTPATQSTISPNTIDKWSRSLQAGFERINKNAGKKCVRGIVPDDLLLSANPWHNFNWIEKREKKKRRFDPGELIAVLDYFERDWAGVTVAPILAKVCLWSWSRRLEVSSLSWEGYRKIGNEHHFETVGKAHVRKWFRIPATLHKELEAIRTDSPFVFAAYSEQLGTFYANSSRPWQVDRVLEEFKPENLGEWFYRRIAEWSKSLPGGAACVHVFRKTTLQHARSGEDVNRQVAADARLGEDVMLGNYVDEEDEEMRQKSNRTFRRIVASLPSEVATQYGYVESTLDSLKRKLRRAVDDEDWQLAARLAGELSDQDRRAG